MGLFDAEVTPFEKKTTLILAFEANSAASLNCTFCLKYQYLVSNASFSPKIKSFFLHILKLYNIIEDMKNLNDCNRIDRRSVDFLKFFGCFN